MKLLIEIEIDAPEEEARDMSVGDPGRPAMDPSEAIENIELALSSLKDGKHHRARHLVGDITVMDVQIVEVLED